MKKRMLFAILEQYANWEAAYLSSAIQMLGQDNYILNTVSLTTEGVESIGGFHTLPDYDLQSIPDNYEALYVTIQAVSDKNSIISISLYC